MKTYRKHRCGRQHRTAQAFLNCAIPWAEWIRGQPGDNYALIAWCDVATVSLHQNTADAYFAAAHVDRWGCGHACTRDHEIVFVDLAGQYFSP